MRTTTKKLVGLAILAVCLIFAAGSTEAEDSSAVVIVRDVNDAPARGSLEARLAKTISIEFRKTAIEDVLRIVADQADVDIVKSPKVVGEVTVTLTDVPLEEALNNILSVHGFTYVLSENMIRVITNEEQIDKPEVLHTKTFEIVYADIEEVVKALEKFKSPKGSVSFIKGTSHIIVTDTENQIREITLFIEKVDIMTKQVLVEARIYDIQSTDNYDLGIEWQAGKNTTYNGPTPENPTAGGRNPFATGTFLSTTRKSDATTGTFRFGWLNDSIDVDATITAQQENIDAKLLANPRILVLDNELAKINIVTEIPYQKLNQGGGNTQSFGTTEFKEVGVQLDVTTRRPAAHRTTR
ncbi:MAG: secretin N-terminal domain-containing protein [Planctomycetota bacterium]|jgi:type IV pilus assembly protein PilQ